MTAEIVWRNPMATTNVVGNIARVNSTDLVVLYTVGTSDAKYELIVGGIAAAGKLDSTIASN